MYKIENASDILLASTIFTDLILVSIKKKRDERAASPRYFMKVVIFSRVD